MKVKVCDALCGAGKTRSCINMMNNSPDKRYLFVTPYLDEVERIKKECSSRSFVSPQRVGETHYSKTEDIVSLLKAGKNIATTHQLFSRLDDDTKAIIRDMGYTMILDEVIDLFQPASYSRYDMEYFKRKGLLKKEEGSDNIYWTDDEYGKDAKGIFSDLVEVARSKNLKQYNDDFYFWCLSEGLFMCFEEVYILTYMYKYQLLAYFLRANGIDYELIGTKKQNGIYQFCPAEEYDRKIDLKGKVHIFDNEKYNEVGNAPYSLSSGWFQKAVKQNGKPSLQILKNNIYCFLRRAKHSEDRMWTTLDKYHGILRGKGYSNSFLCFNMRASNDFADKHYLAFCLNVYTFPWMKNYLDSIGVENVSQDMFALSTIVQWIFRSAIRKGEEIWVYIPSKRMRYLLSTWLDNLAEGKDLEEIKFINSENVTASEAIYAVMKSLKNSRKGEKR